MRKFGLIGYPLGHSFSKGYFTDKFNRENLSDCSYENYPIESIDRLPDLINEPGLTGLNVTIPYKSAVIGFLDSIDPEAETIGAVNVIKLKREGRKIYLKGFNTDITGIYDTIEPCLQKGIRKALVLGTGGSSKAVCHVLKKINVDFTLISRQRKPGSLSYSDLSPEIISSSELIINTTPLGMFPDATSKPPIKYNLLTEKHILFDLVYNPEMTSFLKMGQERGCTVLTGLKMLYSQAEKAWEIWNNEIL